MKKIMVTKSSMPPFEEYIDEIKELWNSHWLTNMGIKHNRLEEELCEYLNVDNISLFTNGHSALELTIQNMNLKGEVITTPFTFASTTHAIVRNGLTPVFCDIDINNYTIDTTKIESLISENTVAIVAVHVYGNICNVDEIEKIAKKHNLKVIYDAAHAFGVKYKGKGIASFGDVSIFSFHATKVFNTIEGGASCYNNPDFRIGLNQLKNFGIKDEETVEAVGANAKMNEFQAAMGLCNLRHINEELAKREIVVNRYIENLRNIKGIKLVKSQEHVTPNFSYLPLLIEPKQYGKSRDEIYNMLRGKNIYSRKYFYPLTSDFDCYQGKYNQFILPVATYVSKNILTLPLYADLSLEEVDIICHLISNK